MSTRICRRSLLAAASAGICGAGFWTSATAEPRQPSPHDRLRLGFIGVGNRGETNVLTFAAEPIDVAALCDVDQRYLRAMSDRFREAHTYTDFRELIEQPNLDAVVISTPDHTHFLAAWRAMRRGLHVYCEKPLAHTVEQIGNLVAEADRRAIVTQTGMQHHASDGYRRAVEWVRSGELGAIREIHAWTNRPIWPQGEPRPAAGPAVPDTLDWELWLGPAAERPYHPTYHPRGWRGWWDFGCGALGDMGPHLLDPVFWALQLDDPVAIEADATPAPAGSFPAASTVRFDFPERDGRPPLRLVWYDGDRQPPASITRATRLPGNGVLLLAERGRMFLPDYGGKPIVQAGTQGATLTEPAPFLTPIPAISTEWLQTIRTGAGTSCDIHYGARVSRTCLLGNLAIRAGRRLRWDSVAGRFANDDPANAWLASESRAGWDA